MFNGIFHIRKPENEPVLRLRARAAGSAPSSRPCSQDMLDNPVEVPCIIGGREVTTGDLVEMRLPAQPVAGARAPTTAPAPRRRRWRSTPPTRPRSPGARWSGRRGRRCCSRRRSCSPASTARPSTPPPCCAMSKTCHQAEIDSACELIDFWRFNPYFMTAGLRRPADLHPGRAQLHGAPPARGVRLRHLPVQLHLHRGQPAHRAGADGQRRGLEAVVRPRCCPPTTS